MQPKNKFLANYKLATIFFYLILPKILLKLVLHNPMIKYSKQFKSAIAAFDELNEKDPNKEEVAGELIAKEVLYAQRMSKSLSSFLPTASETLQLAARCQHLCRWEIPRKDYPTGRKGYHMWRTKLKELHAEKAGDVLGKVGYDQEVIDRVKFLVLKKQLKKDAETQALEDVICLVFLEHYFVAFAAKHQEEKIIDIVQKTWGKMSEKGHKAALQLPFTKDSLTLIQKALA